jgi:hypothetical protein
LALARCLGFDVQGSTISDSFLARRQQVDRVISFCRSFFSQTNDIRAVRVVGVFTVELATLVPAHLECSSRLPRCFHLYKSSVQFEVHASAWVD